MKVLVRLDDYTPNREHGAWTTIETTLDALGIKPVVAVIPNDRHFGTVLSTEEFWNGVRALQAKGWSIALHGETHCVQPIADDASHEVFFATKSEFVGLTLDEQIAKLDAAWDAFVQHGVVPTVFVAPNHGFDGNTVRALRAHGRMQWISDGVSLRPFRDRDLMWLPQIDWKMPRIPIGFRTVCLHPSTMTDTEIDAFVTAARQFVHCFVDIKNVQSDTLSERGIADAVFQVGFAMYFRAREALHYSYTFLREWGR